MSCCSGGCSGGCSPLGLGLLRMVKSLVSRWWKPHSHSHTRQLDQTEERRRRRMVLEKKKYVHVPQHAASSFMSTTTARGVRTANEIL
ncbi:hypothetical protein QBC46DRAFT_253641 [Diplogelasinospora grovesii]|uniref:Uncharacterized protein n=1 Tax=Diplogelasinospora grovesii TaxID=303347 RepID=A0AAN6NGJ9_9PEZI|nr:hypothetical protein QBC46DRAFT_253641 [Diplogelasinospora grovesii]